MPEHLRLHVLGGAAGESIVLGLPGGKWGVVDCYCRDVGSPARNPTLQLLKQEGARELEFVCLTHPHDDHYRGMSHLFESFPVRNFWRFGALSLERLEDILVCLEADALGWQDEEGLVGVNDLRRTFALVGERVRRKETRVVRLSDVKEVY